MTVRSGLPWSKQWLSWSMASHCQTLTHWTLLQLLVCRKRTSDRRHPVPLAAPPMGISMHEYKKPSHLWSRERLFCHAYRIYACVCWNVIAWTSCSIHGPYHASLLVVHLCASLLVVHVISTKGVIRHLLKDGLSNLQYADGTIIFMDHDLEQVKNIQLLLSVFE